LEVVILRQAVIFAIGEPVIHGDEMLAIAPEKIHHADPVDEIMGIAAVLELGQFVGSGVPLVQERIIADEVSFFDPYKILYLAPEIRRRI